MIAVFHDSASGTTSRHARYHSVVTNILDGERIAISSRIFPQGFIFDHGNIVRIDGITAPEASHPDRQELMETLGQMLLGKKVNIVERLESGESQGGSIYITDDPQCFDKHDNLNLRLIRNGLAKWNGENNSSDLVPDEMVNAQRQAQLERRGLWGLPSSDPFPDSAPNSPPVTSTNMPVTASTQQSPVSVTVPSETNAPPIGDSTDSPPPSLVVPLAVGAVVLVVLFFLTKFRKK